MTRNSPTSIIVYNQCPRLYYHQYIERRPSFPHIDLIKGSLVHETLKGFFSQKPSLIEAKPKAWAESMLKKVFMDNWAGKKVVICKLILSDEELRVHYDECWEMLSHWLESFLSRASQLSLPFSEAFEKLKPLAEEEFYLKDYDIKGFIDAVENIGGEIRIIDYKTTSKFEITKEYRLQLAMYAYLYMKKTGKKPDKVGIYFLKERLHLISVDEPMLQYAEQECKDVFEKTTSKKIEDYPQNTGYLCRAMKGNCPCHQFEEEVD